MYPSLALSSFAVLFNISLNIACRKLTVAHITRVNQFFELHTYFQPSRHKLNSQIRWIGKKPLYMKRHFKKMRIRWADSQGEMEQMSVRS